MKRVIIVLVSSLALGCTPCERFLVNGGGDLDTTDAGLTTANFLPFGVEGQALLATMWAPLTSCPDDRVRVWASYEGGEVALSKLEVADGGRVRVNLTLSPHARGNAGLLTVNFEPALGTRSSLVDFVGEFPLVGERTVLVPMGVEACAEGLEMIADGTLLCRADGGGVLLREDGGVEPTDGLFPVAAGNSLWDLTPDGRLHHHFFDAGVSTLTRERPDFEVRDGPFMHTWLGATRWGGLDQWKWMEVNEGLQYVTWEGFSECSSEPCRRGELPAFPMYTLWDRGPWRWAEKCGKRWSESDFNYCLDGIVGLTHRYRAHVTPRGVDVFEFSSIPIQLRAHPLPLERPKRGFSYLPLQFASGSPEHLVLADLDPPRTIELFAIRRSRFVSMSDEFVVLRAQDDTHVVVAPRRR
jgi:hypothetical protein